MCVIVFVEFDQRFMRYGVDTDSVNEIIGTPGVLGIWGEWLFIFRELGSTGNYFSGAREQAHNFVD